MVYVRALSHHSSVGEATKICIGGSLNAKHHQKTPTIYKPSFVQLAAGVDQQSNGLGRESDFSHTVLFLLRDKSELVSKPGVLSFFPSPDSSAAKRTSASRSGGSVTLWTTVEMALMSLRSAVSAS